jgi:hypothetical protein
VASPLVASSTHPLAKEVALKPDESDETYKANCLNSGAKKERQITDTEKQIFRS